MHSKTVPIGHGLDWITQGFGLFQLNPGIWIANLVIFIVLLATVSLLPIAGPFAALLLQPVLMGGLFGGCRALRQGQALTVDQLFDGFREHTHPLMMVGVLSGVGNLLVGLIALAVLVSFVGLGALTGGLAEQSGLAAGGAMLGILLAGLVGVGLSVPIAMAVWFAPALVVFDGLTAFAAMQASFFACLRNLLPFLLYGLVLLALSFVALIPAGLGMLVLGPVAVASVYVSYEDLFGH
ncbi:MAG: BPSS1780 family membrane protein [Candidatus Methylumidiphilus sp.]